MDASAMQIIIQGYLQEMDNKKNGYKNMIILHSNNLQDI